MCFLYIIYVIYFIILFIYLFIHTYINHKRRGSSQERENLSGSKINQRLVISSGCFMLVFTEIGSNILANYANVCNDILRTTETFYSQLPNNSSQINGAGCNNCSYLPAIKSRRTSDCGFCLSIIM